jgi:hypothetical protein
MHGNNLPSDHFCKPKAITCNAICINYHSRMENCYVSSPMKCYLISRSCSKRLLGVSLGCQRYFMILNSITLS